jgi:hypothetical protein
VGTGRKRKKKKEKKKKKERKRKKRKRERRREGVESKEEKKKSGAAPQVMCSAFFFSFFQCTGTHARTQTLSFFFLLPAGKWKKKLIFSKSTLVMVVRLFKISFTKKNLGQKKKQRNKEKK